MRNRTPAPRGRVALILLSIVAIAALAIAGQASAGIGESSPLPSISSDKADYTPGELVTLSGASWAAGESVHVVVNDDAGQVWRYETDVTAGADGSFSIQFNLPELFVASYTATASAASGTASTFFTDANLKFALATADNAAPSNVTWSVNWDQWQGTGQNANNTCAGTRSTFGTANYSGNTLSSGSEAGINNNASAKPTGAQTTGAFAGTYELNYWSSSPTSTTPLNAAQLCQAGVNGPTVFTFYAHFKLADAIAPTTTASASPAANGAGWNKTNVTVDLSATDNAGGSGVKEVTYSASGAQTIASTTVLGSSVSGISITTEGTTTLSFFAKDNANNTEATKTLVLKIDKTAPTISDLGPTTSPNAAGWHKADVVNEFKASDGLSGLDAACQSAFPDPVTGGRRQNKTTSGEGAAVKVSSDSCTDLAGNTAAAVDSAAFKVDKTAPTVVVSLARDPDHNGWYSAPVGYSAAGSDDTSGIDSCQADAVYNSPDGEDRSASLTCRDNAGNQGEGSVSFDYDNTDPGVVVSLARDPDHNGWYNAPVGYSAAGSDDTSGLADCDADGLYNGPDGEDRSASLTCRDNAGNQGEGSVSFDYDNTDPVVTATPSRAPDSNGWYNHAFSVSYSGEDETSGIDSCDADDEYDGPDTAGDSLSGSCTDNAGNSASASYDFKYDATAPAVVVNLARDPDHNGWYNHAVGYSAVGSDALSDIDSCQPDAVYTAPDSAAASVTRTCTDNAGNEGSGSRTFMFDSTDPAVTVNLARDPDHNGWYNAPVGYTAAGSDETSGLDSCQADAVYSGPDGDPVTVTRTCTDNAGNEGVGARSFKYDATAPTMVATLSPPANGNGWNKTDVTVSFTCDDNLSGIDPSYGCPADELLTSQGLHTLHRATSDMAGNLITPSFDVRIDKTNPSISGSASPAANSHGWNNTNVVVSFSCFDGLSSLDFCEPNHTLSANGAGQSVTGHAEDKADNQASATVNDINIDKLPPNVSVTGVADGATYTQGSVPAAGCSTTDQAGLSGVDTPASVSVSGPASGVGSFTATCSGATDRAGNSASASVTYNVNYNWTGFFQPIDNNPDQSGNPALATVWNSAKAGQAIPVKFSLHGNQGLSIFATGYPKSTKVTCPSASTAPDPIETYASSTSGLHYDAAADQYNYVWKTTTALANTCQRLEVKLVDGTSHYAFFRFVK